jgi:hypothetical protein
VSFRLPPGSKILFINADPRDQEALDFAGEYRAISEAIRDDFQLVARLAARPEDLVNALAEEKPQVLHFSGHGSGTSGLAFENQQREMVLLARDGLKRILQATELMAPLRLIVLNACWSIKQARAIAKKGPDTVGMKIDVLDEVAKAFAKNFYRLLPTLSIEGAHRAAIAIMTSNKLAEADSPVFVRGPKNQSSEEVAAPVQANNIEESDRRELYSNVDRSYPGDELKELIFLSFPRFSREVFSVEWKRSKLLMEFLHWVLERPAEVTLLKKVLREK